MSSYSRGGWIVHLLPIAGDSSGNSFFLVLDDEDYGAIYYFDAAEIPLRPDFVTKDFDEFLSKLRELTPDELDDDESLPT